MTAGPDADAVDLHLEPNEASDLAAVPADAVPDGWDAAYVTVLDESVAERAVALLGHRGDDLSTGWEAVRLDLTPTRHADRTEDGEACAFHDGRLYVAGSHYGSKDGPLQPKRAWFGRMPASDLAGAARGERAELELVRNPFGLHRAVNDALREADVDLLPLSDVAQELLIDATIERGEKKDKRWRGRVRRDDHPINVEGMTFRPDGTLLLGLRVPVSSGGDPLLVELRDLDALFADEDAVPTCGSVWQLDCAGESDRPVGVRGMHMAAGDVLHVLVGSLDAEGKDSALLAGRPTAGHAHCEHWRVRLPAMAAGGPVRAESVHDFPDLKTVEGIAESPDGHFLYVVDREGHVHLRFLLVA